MDVIYSVREYITRMVESTAGMKILLLDKATVGIVSLAMTQAQIQQKEVYLFDRLDNPKREFLPHLKAICFLRPDTTNMDLLDKELRKPAYGEYHIFFSNVISTQLLERIADADEHEVVMHIQEQFADYYPINPDFFTLHVDTYFDLDSEVKARMFDRTVQGLIAILQSMQALPSIRHSKNSDLCFKIGQEIAARMQKDPVLFDFNQSEQTRPEAPPLLLLLDRRNDPITPLLTPWTYQAVVHECFGLYNNRVSTKHAPLLADGPEPVLSSENDEFFKENMFKSLGELGVMFKRLSENYIKKTNGARTVSSISDMQRFISDYPDFHKNSKAIAMHVVLASELSRYADDRRCLEISALEQELVCGDDHEYVKRKINDLFPRRDISSDQLLRIIMLYTLRYEQQDNALEEFLSDLFQAGLAEERVELVAALKAYAGADCRSGNLYDNRENGIAPPVRTLRGMEHVPMRHTPLLYNILTGIMSGNLRDSEFPFVFGDLTREKPQNIIVFIAGGATYHEALIVDQLNNDFDFNARVILGGSCIHNTRSFLDELANLRSVKKGGYKRAL